MAKKKRNPAGLDGAH